MAVDTYYFDGSTAPASVDSGSWSNITNADDGSTSTVASSSSEYPEMNIGGTNASGSGTITQVRFRVHGTSSSNQSTDFSVYTSGKTEYLGGGNSGTYTATWTSYFTLSTPTGGWSWQKISDLEFYLVSGSTGPPSYTVAVSRAEVEVTYTPPSVVTRGLATLGVG